MGRFHAANVLFGVGGIALAAAYLWQTSSIGGASYSDPLGPRTLPMVLGLALFGLSIALLIFDRAPPPAEQRANFVATKWMLATTTVLIAGFLVALPVFGFYASSFALAFGFMLIMRARILPATAFSLFLVVSFSLLFEIVLRVPFPRPTILQVLHG